MEADFVVENTDDEEILAIPSDYVAFPEPAGYFVVVSGGINFNPSYERPSRWHRFWARVLLGWKWREA